MRESIEAASAYQPDSARLFSAYGVGNRIAAWPSRKVMLWYSSRTRSRIDAGLDRYSRNIAAKRVDGRDAREADVRRARTAPRGARRRLRARSERRGPRNPAAHVGGGFFGKGDRCDSLGRKRSRSAISPASSDEALRQDSVLPEPAPAPPARCPLRRPRRAARR